MVLAVRAGGEVAEKIRFVPIWSEKELFRRQVRVSITQVVDQTGSYGGYERSGFHSRTFERLGFTKLVFTGRVELDQVVSQPVVSQIYD